MNQKQHFHSFNAFRFLAFFVVFLNHIPMSAGSPFRFFNKSGGLGVSFFFVLSGFLITYILLFHKQDQKNFSLKNFFMRRILRIWPLYFAMVLFAFATPFLLKALHLSFSNEGYTPNWIASFTFLENYKMMAEGTSPNVSPLVVMWSVCVEEHFYILWGLLLYFLPIKRVPLLIITSILLANVVRLIYDQLGLIHLDLFSNFDFFAYGGIAAYLFLYKEELVERIGSIPKLAKFVISFLTISLLFAFPHFAVPLESVLRPTLLGILFMVLIIFSITKNQPIIIGDNSWIGKLGVYTYGLYLYHTIFINLLMKVIPEGVASRNLVIAVLSLLVSIIVSIISYHLFEKRFLNLKKHFKMEKKENRAHKK